MTTPNAIARANDDALVARTIAWSRYARRLLAAEPLLLPAPAIGTPFGADEMRERLAAAGASDDASLMRALRDLRKRVMLRVIARDLNGLATLEEVMATMTTLADIALKVAIDHLQQEFALQHGEPTAADDGSVQEQEAVE